MTPNRRASVKAKAEEDIKVNGKRKKPTESLHEPPKKRQRADEGNTSAMNGFRIQSSKGRLPGKVTPTKSKRTPNGGTSSRRELNRNSRNSYELSPSPNLSEISDDIIIRTPVTPQKRPIQIQTPSSQTPTKSKSSKSKSSAVSEIPEVIPRTALNNRLVEVAVAAKEEKQKTKQVVTPSKSITVNDSRARSKKGPTAKELDSIKSHVLGKLCGRIPIPLTGKPAERAEYF
jgi:hypothetical protein